MIKNLKDLLEVLSSVGIEETIIEPHEGGSLVRGANKDRSVIVFDKIDSQFSDFILAIQSVKALLSRLQLFEGEYDKTKLDFDVPEDSDHVYSISMKKGKRKATYQCANPSKLAVPKHVPNDTSDVSLTFDKDYAGYISQAITSMSYTGEKSNQIKHSISLAIDEKVATISIYDGEHDSFTDSFETDCEDITKHYWEVAPFQRVMKKAVDLCGLARFSVTKEHGIAVFDLSVIFIMVSPMA